MASPGESDLATVIADWHTLLDGAVNLWHHTELTDAKEYGQGLELTVRTGRDQQQRITCDHLVLATGRRGVTSTTALLKRLGVPTELPDISVGIRLEMAVSLLEAIGQEHPDLKVSQLDHAQKIKSFCFCGGSNGGRIKVTNYQDAFGEPVLTLDGHETTERIPGDRALASNFGLLCHVQGRGNALQARDSFIATYRELAGGRLFAQSLRGFLDRRPDGAPWRELQARMPFQPSVLDLAAGPVDRLFTDAEHTSLTAGFGRFMGSILTHAGLGLRVDDILDDVLVVGPELEFLWDKPAIDADCKVPGLPVHVVGDSAGIAQGIVQAAMMGIAAGRHIAGARAGDRVATAPAPLPHRGPRPARKATLEDLYPAAAWGLPVSPALPAPRLPDPPREVTNLGGYRDHSGPFILRELPVAGHTERIAAIDKAFPHALYDLMLLVARDDVLRTHVGNTPDLVLASPLEAAYAFTEFTASRSAAARFGLAGSRLGMGWNCDPTTDRDNGQWWDKRLHLHLNCWPAPVCQAARPVPLAAISDVTTRRSLIDPAADLAHRVMADALNAAALPAGCRLLGPNHKRDASLGLPVGLKVHLPGRHFLTTPQCRALLRALHACADTAHRALHTAFTGHADAPAAWQRPALLPYDTVRSNLTALPWLSPATTQALLRLRAALRDVSPAQLRLLAGRRWRHGGDQCPLGEHQPQSARGGCPVDGRTLGDDVRISMGGGRRQCGEQYPQRVRTGIGLLARRVQRGHQGAGQHQAVDAAEQRLFRRPVPQDPR